MTMSIASRLRFSFRQTETLYFGTKEKVSTSFDSPEMIVLKETLSSFFQAQGIAEYETLEDLFRTGGQADIHYLAVRFANQAGGAELVFAQDENWQGDLKAIDPWITLFGEWTQLKDGLQKALF